jgi:hypothetical protein
MYILTNSYSLEGFEFPAAAAKAIELGSAALTFGAQLFKGGSFQTTSTVVNYMHANTPPERIPKRCTRRFLIKAAHPGIYPLDFIKKRGLGEKFWFELSYLYNGNDLINVAVEPMVNKSSDLSKSEFKITFAGTAISLPSDPVAEIVLRISGTWKAWDPVPYMDTIVSFWGDLFVRADGSTRVKNFKAEKDLVWYDSMSNSCQIIVLQPPLPVPMPYLHPVYFAVKSSNINSNDVREIQNWFNNKLTSKVRAKIQNRELPIILEGRASTTGSDLFNTELSKKRVKRVKEILIGLTGPNADIRDSWVGKSLSPTRNEVEDREQRRVMIAIVDNEIR